MILLQLLKAEPTNGYDLTQRICAISCDTLDVNAGSLADQREAWACFAGAMPAVLRIT